MIAQKAAEFGANHERKTFLCDSQGQIRSSVAHWMDYDANISKGYIYASLYSKVGLNILRKDLSPVFPLRN